jgi:MEDS: MEthanogen/methylotroph, DcmR Sensory domain
MAGSWSDFLFGSAPRSHGVHVYADAGELVGSVCEFLAAGFDEGEPALVVARPEHAGLIEEGLAAQRSRLDGRAGGPILVVADADATLAAVLADGRPSPAAFEEVVGGLLDGLATRSGGRPVRVFGEMVDLLVERGERDVAVELERLWNEMLRRRDFSLLCGYRLDIFDRAAQTTALPEVCRAHSHVLPAEDPARLTRAVDRALDEVFGPAEAGKVYLLIADELRSARVPTPQLVLMWVSANMPALANRLLAAARRNYVDAAAASSAA